MAEFLQDDDDLSRDEYDFIEQPPQDFFCPVTFEALLEPYLTECCGNHLSEEAYRQLLDQEKPCPVCKEELLKAVKDKYHKRRALSLKVRCPHKAEGCEWEGELGGLEQHLNADCQYVEVDCPDCGKRVTKICDLEEHKSQHCPLRPFSCKFCNHNATFQDIIEKHWPVCEKYPLPCPNECGEEEIERQYLNGHIEQTCPLQVIKCEFGYAGCGAQLQRCLMPAHMKEAMKAHLSILAEKAPKLEAQLKQQQYQIKQQGNQIKQQGDQIKQQGDKIKQQGDQLKQQGDELKQQGDQIEQQERQIKQQERQIKQQGDQIKLEGFPIKIHADQIKQLGDKIKDQIKQQGDQIKQQGDRMKQLLEENRLFSTLLGKSDDMLVVPPVTFIMENFEKHKVSRDIWSSPAFYSHLGGYKMHVEVEANFASSRVRVYICLIRGDFDDRLTWPVKGAITLHRPQNCIKYFNLNRPRFKKQESLIFDISHYEVSVQKNGSLTISVNNVKIESSN